MSTRKAGLIEIAVNGNLMQAKGNFTYNLGAPKREGIPGADRVHGFKESVQIPMIEGEATDDSDLDVEALIRTEEATITLKLANGKVIVLRNAWYAADGNVQTEEANIQLKFEGLSAEEVR